MDPFVEDVLEFARSGSYGPILKKILEHEDKVAAEGGWHAADRWDGRPMGWEWYDVGVAPGYLVKLVNAGIVSVVYKSNKHTDYRLTDPELVRKALAGEIRQAEPKEEDAREEIATKDLFDPIVGYDDVKDLFLRAIRAEKPVHMLLEGPPASAKTLFLTEIDRLPRAHFLVGGSTTKAGLTDALLMLRPRYALLDEIETIDNARDYSVLLHLMENQEVIETKYRRHHRTPLKTWVFAAGNAVSKLPAALLSRFGGRQGVIRFKEYTSSEFLEIATNVLVKREGVPSDFAARVATATLDLGSRDVRLSVRLARLARTDEDLGRIAQTMRRRR